MPTNRRYQDQMLERDLFKRLRENLPVSGAIEGLQNFLRYLSNAWGLLSISTPLFPHFETFSEVVPCPRPHSELFSLLATLAGIFVVFYEYTIRGKRAGERREAKAGRFFLSAIILTTFYAIILHPPDSRLPWADVGVLTDLVDALVYIAIFFLFTKSFTVLAVQVADSNHQNVDGQ